MPKLEVLTIASPCTASWEAMEGDDRVRHCKLCHLDVYDLSSMRRAEAERFVAENEGHACVRFLQRPDGTVITEDCATRRETPPRPCAPRPVAPPSPNELGMAAKPRPPSVKMGKVAMPAPEIEPEAIDERLAPSTILAELVRAVRASFEARDAERLVLAIEGLVGPPEGAAPAKCPRTQCALWLVPPAKAFPPEDPVLEARTKTVEEIRPSVVAAFDEPRATALLRELSRHPFPTERGPCPHCKRQLRAPGSAEW